MSLAVRDSFHYLVFWNKNQNFKSSKPLSYITSKIFFRVVKVFFGKIYPRKCFKVPSNVFDLRGSNNLSIYLNIQIITTGQRDDYTTGSMLDYPNPKKSDNIAIDISQQQELDSYWKAIQQINFAENLDHATNTEFFFIIEELKQTILDFSQEPARLF